MTTAVITPDLARQRRAQERVTAARGELEAAERELEQADLALIRATHLERYQGFVLRWKSRANGYWFEAEDGRLVRADHSGDDWDGNPMGPRATEDGPLYVRTDLTAEHAPMVGDPQSYTVAVVTEHGRAAVVLLGRREAEWLFKRYPQMRP
jgi:hypothetical protein